MTTVAVLAMAAAVFADDISNNVDPSIDAVAEVMPLTVGGSSGTTQLYVNATGTGSTPEDGKAGCNLTGSSTLVLSISSSNTAVATVSPASVTFTSCGTTPTLTVIPVAAGSTTISATQTSNSTGGTFNLAPVTFTVNITSPTPPNTAPTIAVAGVTGGASYNKGSVPAATCQVTDAEDGNSSFGATLGAITGPYASDGIGSQTASCSYTDGGGLTASASETYSIVDPSAPSIGYVLTPASPDGDYDNWYRSNVTLTWTVSELESPNSLVMTGCVDQSITVDQAATTYSCSATSAGGSASKVDVTVKRDSTAPMVAFTSATAAAAGGGPNGAGWYKSDVVATFTATDNLSGFDALATLIHTDTNTTSGEGSAVSVGSPAFTDRAGNTVAADAATSDSFMIDLSDPHNVAFVGGPVDGETYYFGFVPAAPTCSAIDDISGLASCVVTGYDAGVGNHTLTATATDNAGRTATATSSYTVAAWTLRGFYSPVDMNQTVNIVKGGSTVPLKFEIFAGSTELNTVDRVDTFKVGTIPCGQLSGDPADEIEQYSTGSTTLRYDSTGGQFIQNWQLPKPAAVCYKVVMTADDGSALTAYFKTK